MQWSPDGSTVLFTRSTDVFVATTDGQRLWRLVDRAPKGQEHHSRPSGRPIFPLSAISVSPDGSHLLYSVCDETWEPGAGSAGQPRAHPEQFDIAVRAIAGGEPQRLTTHPAFDNFPSWSPDGTQIAFLSGRHIIGLRQARNRELAHLYTMAADGSSVRDLTPGFETVVNRTPQWAPDGQRLAFVAHDHDQRRTLYTIRPDGRELRRIGLAVSGSSWSPDGRRLAVAQPAGSTIALVSVAADGTDRRRLATIDGWQPTSGDPDPRSVRIDSVAWSPTGAHVLYTCGPTICVSTTEGTPVRLARGRPNGTVASWSPDGSRIAVAVQPGWRTPASGAPVLYHMTPDGTDVQVVAVVGAGQAPVAAQNGNPDVAARLATCADGTLIRDPAAHPGLVADCQVLLGLRDTLFSPESARSNWNPDTPLDAWLGVTIDGAPPRVVAIELDARGLVGTLPSAIGNLGALHTLIITGGSEPGLSGPLPPELGQLARLKTLVLRRNELSGPIPVELGNLAQLETLDLSDCRYVTGPIPAELGRLTQLQTLNLSGNWFRGPIPPEFGSLLRLRALRLDEAGLTGTIPPELGRLSGLEVLTLQDNALMGPIPPEVSRLTSLRELDLSKNQLTGEVPPEFGALLRLTKLNLTENQLTGPAPAALGLLESLRNLDLSGNRLSGPIPDTFGQLSALESLRLDRNRLSGSIPAELRRLSKLKYLGLNSNQLTGSIPVWLGEMPSLVRVWLDHNRLTGEIPPSLGRHPSLRSLGLGGNQLSGCVPIRVHLRFHNARRPYGIPACEVEIWRPPFPPAAAGQP
ncbi:MAG: hypothetical protein OXP73_05130 [Chloroflexota bacterium]|nr:hypothetical protein [Chloroflexota bacterium]